MATELAELCDRCFEKGRKRTATVIEAGIPLCDECSRNTSQDRFQERTFSSFEPEKSATVYVRQITTPGKHPWSSAIQGEIAQRTGDDNEDEVGANNPVSDVSAATGRIGGTTEMERKENQRVREADGNGTPVQQSKLTKVKKEKKGVAHPCACGCGTILYGSHAYVRGHKQKLAEGKPHKSSDNSQRLLASGNAEPTPPSSSGSSGTVMTVEIGPINFRREGDELIEVHDPNMVQHSVEHSIIQTHKETVTVTERSHEMIRKVSIILPKAQPITHVAMTPKIAEAVWASLTKEQRYDLLGGDDLWDNCYDDDMKMSVINKVLLVYEESE